MLDLRLPIGYFFLINAALLIIAGLAQGQLIELAGTRFNLDIVWGAVMGVFGLLMVGLAFLAKRRSS